MHIRDDEFHPDLQVRFPSATHGPSHENSGFIRLVTGSGERDGKGYRGTRMLTVNIASSLDGYSIRTRIYGLNIARVLCPALFIFMAAATSWSAEARLNLSRNLLRPDLVSLSRLIIEKQSIDLTQAVFRIATMLLFGRATTLMSGCTDKLIIGGHSAGGGLTAAVALKARDTGDVSLAFQMPFYPMIDETQPSDPKRDIDPPVWDTGLNRIGWGAI